MAGRSPGDRSTDADRAARRLAQPPSARYAPRASQRASQRADLGSDLGSDGMSPRPTEPRRSALPCPLVRATLVSIAGAALLVLVGAVAASTFGLLFVSGALGAAAGLVLARASVPAGDARPVSRATVTRLAIALAVVAVVVADVATWLIAVNEGGTLGVLDYLWTTFGPFVPGEALIAAVAALWGAGAGPIQR